MSIRTTTTSIMTASLLAVGAVAPVYAAAPEREVETLEFFIEEHPYFSGECGFPVAVHVWGEFLVRTWADEEGNPVREFRHFKFRSTTSANGTSVAGLTMGPETAVFNPDGSATVHIRGIVNRVLPGEGAVKLDYGSGITIWPADGSDDIVVEPMGHDSIQALCDYLAP